MNNIHLSAKIDLEREFFAKQRKPPSWVLDKLADDKFDGGYKKSKHVLCNVCFEMKSRNNECSCS